MDDFNMNNNSLANLCTGLGLEKRGVRATLQDERRGAISVPAP